MKNKRIINAYDSINPSLSDKQRMLDAILAEAKIEDSSTKAGKTRKAPVYTQVQSPASKRGSIWGTLAAAAVLCVVAGLGFAFLMHRTPADPTYVEPTTEVMVPGETVPDHYAPILEKYRRAEEEGWTKEQCANEGISLRMQAGYDVSNAGYALLDLDGDSREELIIAEESTDRTDNIWDLYTSLEDGTSIQLWVDELTGGQCRLYKDNVISISDSYHDELDMAFYDLQEGKLVMREMLQWEDEDTVFHTDAAGNTRQVTSKEGQSISYAYEGKKLELTWLADITEFPQNMNTVEQYIPIIEKYKTALTENWSWEQCNAADISRQIMYDTTNKNDLGWCLLDIDNNGTEELLVSDGVYLFDLYTLMPTDGQPVHLICADSDYYAYCKDGTIELREHDDTINTYWRWYHLFDTNLAEQDVVYFEAEKHQYYHGNSDRDLKPISEGEVNKYLVNPEKTAMEITLTPFVEKHFPEVREPNYYYEPLIELYRKAIQENWNPGQCIENGISLMIGYYGELYDSLGHNQVDLNGDGNDELIITDGNNIYDLYTIVSDEEVEALRLVDATERQQYFLTTDGYIYEMGSGSAYVGYYSLYTVGQRDLVLERGYMMDANSNADNPWYYYDGVDKGDPCPTSEAAAIIDAIHFAEISFIPFE